MSAFVDGGMRVRQASAPSAKDRYRKRKFFAFGFSHVSYRSFHTQGRTPVSGLLPDAATDENRLVRRRHRAGIVGETRRMDRDMLNTFLAFLMTTAAVLLGGAGTVRAESVNAQPKPWEINLQPAYSPVMERLHDFHNLLLVIIISVVVVVLGILGYVMFRFNARRNPVPSKTSHNTLLEVVWTAVPIMILVVIAIPSLRLLYFSAKAQDPEMTLKVTGHQWYWSYAYPDHGDLTFDSIPVPAESLQPGQPRLLAVDNPVVLPVDTNVQVLVTADDVIHNWAVPSLGLKKDATPGRVNETWVRITQPGTYYGMCSELCGVNHYFMPIQIEALSKEDFAAWTEKAKEQFASKDKPAAKMAAVGQAN